MKRENILLPNVGLHLKFHGIMEATRETVMLYVHTNLPNITQLVNSLFELQLHKPVEDCNLVRYVASRMKNTVLSICDGRRDILNSLKDSVTQTMTICEYSLQSLIRYIPQIDLERGIRAQASDLRRVIIQNRRSRLLMKSRNKRVDPIALTEIYKNIKPRLDLLEEKIKEIDNVHNYTLKIEKQMSLLANTVESGFEEIYARINDTHKRINNLTESVTAGFRELLGMIGGIRDELTLIRFSAKMNSMTSILVQTTKDLQIQMYMVLKNMEEAIHTLEKGYLPETLVSHTQLEEYLKATNAEIYKHFPDFEVMVKNPKYYYTKNNVFYAVKGYSLLLQIPVYLKQTKQPPYLIYSGVSYYVPYAVNEVNRLEVGSTTPSYTKIDLQYEYIAISERQYILMHPHHMSQCQLFANRFVCEGVMMQSSSSVKSCLSSIMWNLNMKDVAELCPLKFYRGLSVPASTYEDDQYILIANVKETWTIQCRNEQIPRKVGHDQYCLIKKSNLCHCKILVAHKYFIQQQIYGCKGNDQKIHISYPVNGLVIWHFQDKTPELKENFDFFATHPMNVNFTTPKLQILKVLNQTDVLLEPYQGGVNFDHVRQLIKSDTAQFRSNSDKIWHNIQKLQSPSDIGLDLSGWHMPSLWSIFGFSSTTVIIGIVIVIFCCYCIRQNRSNAMAQIVTGMTSAAGLPTVKAERGTHEN